MSKPIKPDHSEGDGPWQFTADGAPFTISVEAGDPKDAGAYEAYDLQHHAYLAAVSGADARTPCPYCGPEGTVLPILVRDIGAHVFMCDECEAVWMSPEDFETDKVESWSAFALRHAIPDNWAGITIVMPS